MYTDLRIQKYISGVTKIYAIYLFLLIICFTFVVYLCVFLIYTEK